MNRVSLLLCLIFFPYISFSQTTLVVRWLSVASILIDDGTTKLLFDPAWTRPHLFQWLGLSPLRSNPALVKKILKSYDLEPVNGVFASHSHFDHVIDAPLVAKYSGAIFYTDESQDRISKAYYDPSIKTLKLTPNKKIKIGQFSVTPIERNHAKILHLFDFLPGEVPQKTSLSLWDYKIGKTWLYLIEHPAMTILLDQGSRAAIELRDQFPKKVDLVIQGVANRKSDAAFLNGYVKLLKPDYFMPIHFDNFLFPFDEKNEYLLPGIQLERLLKKVKHKFPKTKIMRPSFGQNFQFP